MLEKAFGCELAHHIRHPASLSQVFPFYRMPSASTGAPAMMFANAVAAAAAANGVVAGAVAVKSLHAAVVVGIAAGVATPWCQRRRWKFIR